MKKQLSLNWIVLIVLSVVLSSCNYNSIVNKSESVDGQWANVQSAYQRRADLVPNLVATVKGYATHEQETLTKVIEARAKATSVNINAADMTPEKMKAFQSAQGELSGALSRLLVSVEQYPDLKANQNFLELQSQLEGTENRINVERNKYNDMVKDYNATIKSFPTLIYAGWFGFAPKTYFEADAGSDKAPTVDFSK